MTDDEMHATMTAFENDLAKKQSEGKQSAAEENKKAGEAFLAENKKKEGVVTLPSGLQYKILKAAKGKKPTDADTVECHYRGTLIDGTEFDSSYSCGKPATFPVAGVIPGWTEALKLMPVGSKWQCSALQARVWRTRRRCRHRPQRYAHLRGGTAGNQVMRVPKYLKV